MRHPKEDEIEQWLGQVGIPTFKQIKDWAPDFETMVMTVTLAELPLSLELKDYCRGIPLEDRIDRYHPYPKWFEVFVRQDIIHAVKFLILNNDAHGYGKKIVEQWKDDAVYFDLVKNSGAFTSNRLDIKFEKVVLHNEKNSDNEVTEYNIEEEFRKKINSGDQVSFKQDSERKVFYFLNLNEFAEIAQKDLNALSDHSDKVTEDFICRDVFAKAMITDRDVLIEITSDIALLFDIEPKLAVDKKSLKKDAYKELKEQGVEFLEEQVEDTLSDIATLVGGRPVILAKMAYKLAKKAVKVKNIIDENVNITFDEDDEKDFFERFAMAFAIEDRTIKSFFLEEIKTPLKKVYIKNRLDFSQLSDSFFEEQYVSFMQKRFYAKTGQLSKSTQSRLDKIVDIEVRETHLFIAISKKAFQNSENSLCDID